jgi:hypothetical protein
MKKIFEVIITAVFIIVGCSKKNDNTALPPNIYHNITQLTFSTNYAYKIDSIQLINNEDVWLAFESSWAYSCPPPLPSNHYGGDYYSSYNSNVEIDYLIDPILTNSGTYYLKRFSAGYSVTLGDTTNASWYSGSVCVSYNAGNCNGSGSSGNFLGQDGYFVYRIKNSSGGYNYGWCHLSMSADASSESIFDIGTDQVVNQIPKMGYYN